MGEQRAIGIDLGGTKILAGVVDRAGKIIRSVERPTPLRKRPPESYGLVVEGRLGSTISSGAKYLR